MYIGEINDWRRHGVFETIQEAMEEIQFPSFEWYEGLLVIVEEDSSGLSCFEGIFSASECVNVSKFMGGVGLITAYGKWKNPVDLMRLMAHWMTHHEVIRAYCECMVFVPAIEGTEECVNTTLKFLRSECTERDVMIQGILALEKINNMPDRNENRNKTYIYYAYLRCADIVDTALYSSEWAWQKFEAIIKAMLIQHNKDTANALVVNKLREVLPFRNIATRIASNAIPDQ